MAGVRREAASHPRKDEGCDTVAGRPEYYVPDPPDETGMLGQICVVSDTRW